MTDKNVLALILEPEADGGMQEWELALLNSKSVTDEKEETILDANQESIEHFTSYRKNTKLNFNTK